MKYLPREEIKTSCKDCIFGIYDNLTQKGCMAGRIEKFGSAAIEAYDEQKEFYIIKEFCNLYRTAQWNNGNPDIKKALDEISITFDILVDCEHIGHELCVWVDDILRASQYNQTKLGLHLYHTAALGKNQRSYVIDLYKKHPNIKISIFSNRNEFLHNTVWQSRRMCSLVVDRPVSVGKLSELNDYVNIHLKKFAVAKLCEGTVLSNSAYRLKSFHDQSVDYDVNLRSLTEISQQKDMYIEL